MAIVTLKELRAALPKGKRLIGIDHGSKTWGLAISNPDLTIASPLKTIERSKFKLDIQTLADTCAEYGVGGFVIGLPLNMDGSEGPRVDSVRHFADNLMQARDMFGFEPLIAFFDEQLSTYAVDEFLNEHTRLSRKHRDKVIDKLAAQVILHGALEKMGQD
ncbi:MAG: Holliday junction resolvase RuvX [Proteobacteria bacterium]|nr:Holliday junction resolvase RuvX [Pseudomonadota bacterium]